ncbi:MAG: hypothetical protein KGV44_13540 [Flavobacteriaceae bacterium]|nr:hypothetical protein [Flavobacteriaceae bacterium]
MVVKERNKTNVFINLLNYRAKESLFAENFTEFENEPHRLEYFLSVRGISFLDDTKAQSVNAIWYSLENMNTQVSLIIKDIAQVEDLLKIKPLLMLKVKNLIFLTDKSAYFDLLRPIVENVISCKTIDEAVNFAYQNTEKGEAVLFCGGIKIDEERESKEFQNAVRNL